MESKRILCMECTGISTKSLYLSTQIRLDIPNLDPEFPDTLNEISYRPKGFNLKYELSARLISTILYQNFRRCRILLIVL